MILIFIIGGLAIVALTGFFIYKKAVSDKSSVLDKSTGVTENQLDEYIGSCQDSKTRIIRVLVRFDIDLHAEVNELVEAMDRIIVNCQEDPKDIKYAFIPESMQSAAHQVEEYARLSRDREHLHSAFHLKEFPKNLPGITDGFKEAFAKMREDNLFEMGYMPATLKNLMESDVVLQKGSGNASL